MFESLFKGVSSRFGLRTIEKYIENLDFLFCQSFQNIRLGLKLKLGAYNELNP
jgi:hypothetical protein